MTITKVRAPIGRLAPDRGPIRVLRGALLVMVGLLVAVAVRNLIATYPVGVDLEIPLRAARRWLDGGQPYLSGSFQAGPGYDLPFLYPPFVLPIVAPLLALPRLLVTVIWLGLGILVAVWTCRQLAIPWRWIPLGLLWPPFFEALLGGNVQLILFAAFAALMYARPGGVAPWHPVDRDPGDGDRPALVDGLLAVANGALKVSQVHPWVLLLRRRPRAAVLGAAVVVAIVLATLPLTGIELWFDWLAQLNRANDPSWPRIGSSFTQYLPWPVGLGVTVATLGLAFVVPRRHAGAWLGILMVVGGPSLRTFGLLYLLPSMLLVRREFALVAAFLLATYMVAGIWLAVILIAATLVLGLRYPALLEPVPEPA